MSRENNQMAYIAEITHLVPIRDADAIEKAVINAGWPVVVKKGEFNVGDLVVYFEIDSWVPTELAPFLSKGKEPREYNGVKGEKLRSIRLRGTRSQGLVLKLEDCFDVVTVEGVKYINTRSTLNYEDANANISNTQHGDGEIVHR